MDGFTVDHGNIVGIYQVWVKVSHLMKSRCWILGEKTIINPIYLQIFC